MRYVWSFELQIIGSNSFYDDNLAALMELIGAGKIKPVIDKVLSLEEAREGLRLIQDREVIGKVVVKPCEDRGRTTEDGFNANRPLFICPLSSVIRRQAS